MAEYRTCPECGASWTRGNTESIDLSVERAAVRVAREHSQEARAALSEAIRKSSDARVEYFHVWSLGVCPHCVENLKKNRSRGSDESVNKLILSRRQWTSLFACVLLLCLAPLSAGLGLERWGFAGWLLVSACVMAAGFHAGQLRTEFRRRTKTGESP